MPYRFRVVDAGGDAGLVVYESQFSYSQGDGRFAPPEMLTEDIAGIDALRKSPKIDVYATASVIYRLACGHAPFDLEAEAAQSVAGLDDAADSRGEKGSGKMPKQPSARFLRIA